MIQKRVTSTGQDNLQQYILDDALNIVSVQQGAGATTSILDGRAPDDIVASVQGGSPVFPLADQAGSEGAFTDGSGNVVGREFYEPYGASSTLGTVGLPQFTGRPLINTALSYDRARFYDSTSGRFLSEDPIGLNSGTANFYNYAAGNPVLFRDPLGLRVQVCNTGDWTSGHWYFKTDSKTVGMGPDGPYLSKSGGVLPVGWVNNSGYPQAYPDGSCMDLPDVDEQCVNAATQGHIGHYLAPEICQGVVRDVVAKCMIHNPQTLPNPLEDRGVWGTFKWLLSLPFLPFLPSEAY
jgi:RHS repeat-associated protein